MSVCFQIFHQANFLHLLHPKNGGVAQPVPMTQVNTTAPMAWLCPNLKPPKGLQMTTYLSKARTARDHPVTRPARTRQASAHQSERNVYAVQTHRLCLLPAIAPIAASIAHNVGPRK